MSDQAVVITWNPDGSGTFRTADGATGSWDGQGNATWSGTDGSLGQWRANGSMTFREGENGSRHTRQPDGSGTLRTPDGAVITWNSAGDGQWTRKSGGSGRFHADGSGAIHHPDGSVELWNALHEITFLTPDGMEFTPREFLSGEFSAFDGSRICFMAAGPAETDGVTLYYHPDGSGEWRAADGEHLTWEPGEHQTLRTQDGALVTISRDGTIAWEKGEERCWLESAGGGGWRCADGSRGEHAADGACYTQDPDGRQEWRDAAGHTGWQERQGSRGGVDLFGGVWSRHTDGSGTFSIGDFSAIRDTTGQMTWKHATRHLQGVWNPATGAGETMHADGRRESWQSATNGELLHPNGACEAWDGSRSSYLAADGAIGVLEEQGAGSWSTLLGDLDRWNMAGDHQISHADGVFETIAADGSYAFHGPEGSVQLGQRPTPDPQDPMALRARIQRIRLTGRAEMLAARLGTLRVRSRLSESGLDAQPVPPAGVALAQARMQMVRIRLQATACQVWIRRMQHRLRRPQPRLQPVQGDSGIPLSAPSVAEATPLDEKINIPT
ncbi:MAG: hypothetical protein HQL95_07165 [Magnetococcales bacterium]|nr:hypothetical protein [Magnetococcales bacterium]